MSKKTLTGKVTSNKMNKTVAVEVSRRFSHPIYRKVVEMRKKFLAHTEEKHEIDDIVTIEESRPLSKRKRWVVVEDNQKGKNKSQEVKKH